MSDVFGSRLKDLRWEQKMSLKSLCDYLGISVATLSNYERNERKPDFDTMIKIADYFNVSIDYLLGRTDAKNPSHPMLDNLVRNFSELSIDKQIMMATIIANISMGFETDITFYNSQALSELCKLYEEIWSMQVMVSSKIFKLSKQSGFALNPERLEVFKMYNQRKISTIECMDDWFEKCYSAAYCPPASEE